MEEFWAWLMTCNICGEVHEFVRHDPRDIMSGGTWSKPGCKRFVPKLNPNEVARLQSLWNMDHQG